MCRCRGAHAERAHDAVRVRDSAVARSPAMRRCSTGGHRGGAGQDEAKQGSHVCSGDSEEAADGGAKGLVGVVWAPVTATSTGSSRSYKRGRGK
jgi:hypothetical protein